MSDYTTVEKEISNYNKRDKRDKGWFIDHWFHNWLAKIFYTKVEKETSVYLKIDKE